MKVEYEEKKVRKMSYRSTQMLLIATQDNLSICQQAHRTYKQRAERI